MYTLHRFLVDYDMALLRALAQRRGVALATNRQTEAADQLATALLDPLSVRVALAQLSDEGRSALNALLAAEGRMRAPQFFRRFGAVRPVGPGRLEREAPWQQPANAAEELFYLGLVFRAFLKDEGGAGEFVVIPGDLEPLLPQPRPAAPPFAVEAVPAPERPADSGPAFVNDLFAYLVHLQLHDVRTYADGRLSRLDTSALRRRLSSPDERRLALLRHLADRLGLVVRHEGLLRLEPGPVRRWLSASTEAELSELQVAWRDDPDWRDLCRVPGLVCDDEAGWLRRLDPVATRRALLALLARCGAEAWWTVASFVALVKECHPDFQRPDGDYGSWYIRDAAGGAYLSGFEAWDQVEGLLIADLLAGPLCWLGAVATGTVEGRPACRLTASGARLVGLSIAEPPPSPPVRLAVHPDFRAELAAPANLYARFQLERFAEPESAEPCRYRITVGSLGRAMGRGVQVDQVLAFLHRASGRPLPANVVGQMRLWAGRFDQVRLEETVLLHVKEERVLKELTILPETKGLIAQVLSPTMALVRHADLPQLRTQLRALGYLREAEGSAGGSAEGTDER